MASVRVKFKPSAVEGKEGVIYYQITLVSTKKS